MAEEIYLKSPTADDLPAIADYKAEFCGATVHGGCGLTNATDLRLWLNEVHDKKLQNQKGLVESTTFLAVKKSNNKIVGITNIRHRLSPELLLHGGHIGYSIRPQERKKGYATTMLGLALKYCRQLDIMQVLVTCDADNIGSAKTIKNNGGILQDEILSEGKPLQRYWIKL